MTPVDEYIYKLKNTHHQHLMSNIHQLLMTYPGITCKLRFRVPFYGGRKWICYINPIKKNGVEVCFIKGFELSPKPQLQAFKRTMVKGISIYQITALNLSHIAEVFEEAMQIDQKINL
jgi:hypothetical protein